MAFFFVRNTLGVLFCQGMLWSSGKITAAKATTTVSAAQSRTLSTTTESTPTAKTESTILLTSTNSTSLTTTIQSPSYSSTTLSTSLPTNELSFLMSTPKASSSLPTTSESKPLPTTTKSTSVTTTIQWSSLPTAFESTSLPAIIKSKTLPETTHSTFLPMTTRPKPFSTTIESSSNPITMKSPSLPTTTESTTLPVYTRVFLPKATKPTSLSTTTQGPSLSTSLPTEHKTSETTKGENENKGSGQSSEESNVVVYGVVALGCVVVFLVALLFIMRRKDNFIMTCIKRNRNEARGEEGRGQEMSHYASVGDLILSFPDDDSPEDKNLPGQPADETQDSPVYDVLEGPYSPPMEGGFQSNEQSKTVHDYASINDSCVMDEEISYPIPSGNFEVSFLEEIYTTLNADRGNEEGNLYESLCDHKTSNERSDSWSIRGMQSMDQDYVSVVSD